MISCRALAFKFAGDVGPQLVRWNVDDRRQLLHPVERHRLHAGFDPRQCRNGGQHPALGQMLLQHKHAGDAKLLALAADHFTDAFEFGAVELRHLHDLSYVARLTLEAN